MKIIGLTQGQYALIDDEDFERVKQYKWCAVRFTNSNTYYAITSIGKYNVLLHRFILNITDPKNPVDHKNHNGLDCQRRNIREASCSQNKANRIATSKNKFRGVHQSFNTKDGNKKYYNKWIAQISKGGKTYLEYRKTEVEAAIAYNEMAFSLYGDFAILNIIPDMNTYIWPITIRKYPHYMCA